MAKKTGSLVALLGLPKKPEEGEDEDEDAGPSEEQLEAMERLGTALDAKDWPAAVEAYLALKMACEDY